MDIKAGIKTTEFWLTVAAIAAVAVLVGLGKVQSVEQAITAVSSMLAVLGYSLSRGRAKEIAIFAPSPETSSAVKEAKKCEGESCKD